VVVIPRAVKVAERTLSTQHPIVDVHAHAFLPEVESLVEGTAGLAALRDLEFRRNGAESSAVSGRMFGQRIGLLTSVTKRLDRMDSTGVDAQVVSPSPSHYHYWADEPLAEQLTRAANEAMARVVAQRPDRLSGLGLVPLQHPALMPAALEHAVTDCGLRGVEISSHAIGPDGSGTVELSDRRLDPFWQRAEELRAVIFLHPFGCTLDERLDRFYLANTVGQPTENAVALSHLIFSGVLDRFPDLIVVAAHGGGYLPTHIGRSDHAWRVRSDAGGCEHPPSSYLRRLYFDSLVHDEAVLAALINAAGPDRVLLGSDFPFDMGADDPVQQLAGFGLTEQQRHAILGDTAVRLGLLPSAK